MPDARAGAAMGPGNGSVARLRVGFAGTPAFAAQALDAICAAGHEVPLVLTQPDRPAGRGQKLQASAVKQRAQALGRALAQPRSLRLDGKWPADAGQARDALVAARLDVLVVAAYGLILPRWTLDVARHGALNIHASLLPRWRGAAPIQRAIEAGDAQTGITIMQMDEGLDTGAMLLRRSCPIDAEDSTGSLHDRLAALGAEAIVAALPAWADGTLAAVPQPEVGACYAAKIEKAEAAIDWARPAAEIERRVRAFDPAPGAHFGWRGEAVKLWRARVIEGAGAPGECLGPDDGRWRVACGEGALELLSVQRPGGRRTSGAEAWRALGMAPGSRLGG